MSTASVTPPLAGASAAAEPPARGGARKLSLLPLIGLVVGSMIGGGVYNLPGSAC